MASAAQRAANRLNSQKSTGPVSEAGKAASSQNARKLGLATGNFKVLAVEDQEDFNNSLAELTAEYKPATFLERKLVEKMARHYWCSQRALVAQDLCFGTDYGLLNQEPVQKYLAVPLRYHATHDRAFHKYRQELEKLQDKRRQSATASAEVKPENRAAPVRKRTTDNPITTPATAADTAPAAA
jgi:hypothetical protein